MRRNSPPFNTVWSKKSTTNPPIPHHIHLNYHKNPLLRDQIYREKTPCTLKRFIHWDPLQSRTAKNAGSLKDGQIRRSIHGAFEISKKERWNVLSPCDSGIFFTRISVLLFPTKAKARTQFFLLLPRPVEIDPAFIRGRGRVWEKKKTRGLACPRYIARKPLNLMIEREEEEEEWIEDRERWPQNEERGEKWNKKRKKWKGWKRGNEIYTCRWTQVEISIKIHTRRSALKSYQYKHFQLESKTAAAWLTRPRRPPPDCPCTDCAWA